MTDPPSLVSFAKCLRLHSVPVSRSLIKVLVCWGIPLGTSHKLVYVLLMISLSAWQSSQFSTRLKILSSSPYLTNVAYSTCSSGEVPWLSQANYLLWPQILNLHSWVSLFSSASLLFRNCQPCQRQKPSASLNLITSCIGKVNNKCRTSASIN